MADVITYDGFRVITALLAAASTTNYLPPLYCAWGIGTSAAGTSNTALGTPTAPTSATRQTGTRSQQTTTTSGDTYRVTSTITSTGSFAITEFGISDSATTTGNNFLVARSDYAAINVIANDSISYTHNTICTTTA